MMKARNIANRKRIRFWIICIGIMLTFAGFVEMVDDVIIEPKSGDMEYKLLDKHLAGHLPRSESPIINQVVTDLTALGSISVLSTFLIILLSLLIVFRDYRGLLYQVLIAVGAFIVPYGLKIYFDRPRPNELEHLTYVATSSFPSGHAFGAAAIYIGLAYYAARYSRSWQQEVFFYLLSSILILIVSLSRVYLGVHYPTDVIAGVCGGALWALSVTAIFEYMEGSRQLKGRPTTIGTAEN